MKFFISLLFFCFVSTFSIAQAVDEEILFNSGTGDLTIKELSKSIEKLKEEDNEFQKSIQELSKDYGDLVSYIKTDLTPQDLENIKNNIQLFLQNKRVLDEKLKQKILRGEETTEIKKSLLKERIVFYEFLSQYVDKEKWNDFIEHIKFHVQSSKERKELLEKIMVKQRILDQKITYLKDKIENHKEVLQTRIENTILKKISQKIEEIESNEKYSSIDQKIKNEIYQGFIQQIEEKLVLIEKSNLSKNYIEMRKNVLNKLINEIQTKIR